MKKQIKELILPSNSQGKTTDNPDILKMWWEGKDINPKEWPYIMLCKTKDKKGQKNHPTWHILCNDYNIPNLIRTGMKELIDAHISRDRQKDLKGIELLCRRNIEHVFLED